MIRDFSIILLSFLCMINVSSSEMTPAVSWIVSLATIKPRFRFCNDTINSWLKQTIKPKHILIFVNSNWDPRRERQMPLPDLREGSRGRKFLTLSHTELLRRKIAKYFPQDYASGVISVVEIPKDYGPATKFVGALMSFHLYEADYWLISDDDLIYDEKVIERYEAEYEKIPPKATSGPILTFFNSFVFKFDIQLFEKDIGIDHVQGADTYVIPSIVLKHHEYNALPLSFAKFPMMLDHVFQKCPTSFIQDDYTISFAFRVSNITILSMWDGKNVYIVNDHDDPSELHLDHELGSRKGGHIMSCLQNEAQTIVYKIWQNRTT